jgi:putative serine protease PepD
VTVTDASGKGGMLSGAGVTAVTPGSAASQAGLKRGDVITKVGSEPVTGADSLVATIRGHRPGDTVTLTVVRGGSTKTFQVTLGSDGGKSLS